MKLTKIESYEIQAFAFRVMTGYMAPGKDVSPLACEAPYEERCAAWDEWRNKHAHCILAMLHGFETLIDRDDEPTGALRAENDRLRAAVQHEADCVEAAKAEVEALRAERDALKAESESLREMLAHLYAGPDLYSDDGELQDARAVPFIDFKRDTAADIRCAMVERKERA